MSLPRPNDVELKEQTVLQTSVSHDETIDMIDPKLERRLKWKLDLFILPLISSVYFFASMGRSDLGNAQVAGLSDELNLSPRDYANAATIFLVAYVVFQLPGTLLIKLIGPSRQFGAAMILWGSFTAITVVIKNHGELLAFRFLIGAAEAFVQGGVFYLSFWYKYSELATRGAVFYSMSTIAGAFNGLIAYAITKDLDGGFGYDEVQTQLFTVIVYVCGCIGVLFWSRVADITNARGLTLAASSVGAVAGYAMLIAVTARKARFAATCLVAFSMYPNIVLQLSWSAMSFAGYTRRGSSLAFFNIFSQLFSISGNQAYLDPPYYRKGNTASLVMAAVVIVVSLILRWYLGHLNEKKKQTQFSPQASEQRQKSVEELGDRHPGM
ncbi:Fc.00g116390.m01.CDS01 [Cosmosporella sp. VM-42]